MKRICLFFTLLTILLYSADVYSQTTHAHSSTRQWHGINVQDIVDHIDDDTWLNANYPKIKQTYTYKNSKWQADADCGIPIYLYNVGTDKFVIEGGDWGMEGRLFYEDFGRQMMLILEETSPGNNDWQLRINPHITEDRSDKKCRFTLNVPRVTKGDGWNSGRISLTTIMDGHKDYSKWDFERVETEPESEFYTFRMSQQFTKTETSDLYDNYDPKSITFRLGAAYGELRVTNSSNTKGTGYYVHIDDDRTCWTSAGNPSNSAVSPWGNKTKVQVGTDMIEIDELYQWRIIPETEFVRVLNEETVGLNPSISSLIPDRDFTRNSNEFEKWQTSNSSNVMEFNETNGGRFGYTWGYISPGHSKDEYQNTNTTDDSSKDKYYDAPWNGPLILKKVYGATFDAQGMKESKYGFMSFEGCGRVYVRIEVPNPGWYEIEYVAINFAPESNPAYFYALADGAMERPGWATSAHTAMYGYQEMSINRYNNATVLGTRYNDIDYPASSSLQNKHSDRLNLSVAEALLKHRDDFTHKFWIYIDPTYYNSEGVTGGKGLTLGIRKDYATKTEGGQKDGVKYYYDSDWTVLDDIQVSYMGLAPAFLYEDEEDLQYLVYDKEKEKDRPGATPDNKYSGSLSLARSLKKGQWNSFSMPVPLIGEQVRAAFGEDAQLLELHSIGGLSENAGIIDFQSVELKPIDPYTEVVSPGKFYLLKPTADPVDGLDAKGNMKSYYELGRNFFTVNPDINKDKTPEDEDYYTHYVMDPSILSSSTDLESWNSENDGAAHVSYVQTPGYSTFAVTSGVYNGVTAPTGTYAPKGSYVMSSGKIYEINKDTRIKGFRGWITLTHSLFTTGNNARISIDGVIDEDGATGIDATSIVPQRLADDTDVYDLGGRKVGTLGMTLPKGIYIVKGKKFMVN